MPVQIDWQLIKLWAWAHVPGLSILTWEAVPSGQLLKRHSCTSRLGASTSRYLPWSDARTSLTLATVTLPAWRHTPQPGFEHLEYATCRKHCQRLLAAPLQLCRGRQLDGRSASAQAHAHRAAVH